MTAARKRDTINLPIRPEERGLIDRAAAALGKTPMDFVLDAAMRAAEATLLDRSVLVLDPDQFDAFVARLDAPLRENPRLCRTMVTKAPWDGM